MKLSSEARILREGDSTAGAELEEDDDDDDDVEVGRVA